MGSLKQYWNHALESPGWKTLLYSVSSVLTGLFSGTFIAEITVASGLNWAIFHKTYSFWMLVVLTWFLYIYNRAVYEREVSVEQFTDAEYCIAYMRSKCLPEAAQKYRELIRSGSVGDLEKAMDEVRKVLKP